ncbi:MAG: hypothetical protein GX964_07665 [Syntrophomonadaceae bacterium]|nr:hypothetical protein [Syntrophomonadaceae bacterium]
MAADKKESILSLARNTEEKIFLARCIDYISIVKKRSTRVLTDFLDPGQNGLLQDMCRGYRELQVSTWGGYQEAERCRALVYPSDDTGSQPDFQIQILRVVPLGKQAEPGHRDYLGSLLGLGIKRDVIGDIVPLQKEGAAVFVAREMALFLSQNLDRVGRHSVRVESIEPDGVLLAPRTVKTRMVTVAALRLDALVSRAFNLSRSTSASLIRQGKVKQNWRQQLDPAAVVGEGDTISCRGYGKFRVSEDAGLSRKGRTRVVLEFPN